LIFTQKQLTKNLILHLINGLLRWSFLLLLISSAFYLASCHGRTKHSQEQKTPETEIKQSSPLIDTLNQSKSQQEAFLSDSVSITTKPKAQSSINKVTKTHNISTKRDHSEIIYYGDFVYEKKTIKERDTSKVIDGSDCGNDILIVNKKGTTLLFAQNKFFPDTKDDIAFQFNEYYNIDEIVNTDLSKFNLTNTYLGISRILSISAINKSNQQKLQLSSEKCSSECSIFIPLLDTIQNLHAYQIIDNYLGDSVLKGQYFYENDSVFYKITSPEISPIILAVDVAKNENDFKLKFKNKRWTSSIENILCYSEIGGLCYSGIMIGKGKYSFPSLLNPNKTVLYIRFHINGKSIIYKNELSKLNFSERKNSYRISKNRFENDSTISNR
jgi:hypothetical protein